MSISVKTPLQTPSPPHPSPEPLMARFAAGAATSTASGDAFWTACPSCCYVHSYPRAYVGRLLRCPTHSCRRPFPAAELPSPPPAVPGTDMYFCCWAFFPLGPPSTPDGWVPFSPFSPPPPPPAAASAGPTSRKKVGVSLKRRALEEEAEAEAEAEEGLGFKRININEAVEFGDMGFRIEDIGFLRDEEIPVVVPPMP